MAAADVPFVYKPLFPDDDGDIKGAFEDLSHYANLIETYTSYAWIEGRPGMIRKAAMVIKYRDRKVKVNDDGRKYAWQSRPGGRIMLRLPGWSLRDCRSDFNRLMPDTKFREHLQVFDIFSKPEFEHHPFHYHKFILLGVEAQLKFHLTEAINRCNILEKIKDEDVEDQMEQRIFTAEYMLYSLIPQLHNITKTIRKLIIISQDGYYSKTHASNIVMLYRKNSGERRKVITQMVQNKCVPSKNALYEVINTRENGLLFVEEEWRKSGGRREYGYVQSSVIEEDNKCFVGRFELALIPVEYRYGNHVMERSSLRPQPEIGMLLGAPPKLVYICDHIGTNKYDRFYFSPTQFPTPNDLTSAGTGDVFESLKSYIEYASEKGGSPVVCMSYKPGCKKFTCKHSKNCKFSFLVKWDVYGYYVHLYNAKSGYIGCEYHNHNRVLASPYVKFGCDYCKVTYHRLADALEHQECCEKQKQSKRHFPYLGQDAFNKRLKVSCDRTVTLAQLEKSTQK